MSRMLKHKDGSLFVWTAALAALPEMEEVIEDPVAAVIAEVQAEAEAVDELEALLNTDTAAEPVFKAAAIEKPRAKSVKSGSK